MTKRMVVMLLVVGLLFAAIFGFQAFKAKMIKQFMATMKMPPATVTAMKAELQPWQPQLNAVGSLRAVHGVDVTTEIGGLVREVRFKSGDEVKAGQVLVQLNADADVGLLRSLEAAAELARIVYERDKEQFAIQAVSKAVLDGDAADLKSKEAQVAQQAAVVEKKTIRAMFEGRLGINAVNLGQYVNPGDKIVTLQSLDPIFVDFFLPQQNLSRLKIGLTVTVTTDAIPGRTFEGRINAINPKVDPDTRNLQIEATIANAKHELLPGMYATVTVQSGGVQQYLTLPQTSVTFNPYGESVYVIEEGGKGADGKPVLTARQTFVTVGETRGDQVAILKGIKPGDLVATSGQLKLKNGSAVVINNTVQPSNDPAPKPVDQ
ncbi:MAG TPA: efflux RND transporter periplasmic adaptor subunit [Nitrospiria bacterium]|jgi:membrane fusion protein (multidrug efflux system)|nr:efflux RND transporter periplasmic adaptor subunit [Nitrospiria bacterium]